MADNRADSRIETNTFDLRLFRQQLRSLEREISLSIARETDCCGVSSAQCHVLLEVEANPGLGISELADILGLEKSTLSRAVETLRRLDFLHREAEDGNRRKSSVSLTEKGKLKAEEIHRLCDHSYRSLFAAIPGEKHPCVAEAVGILAQALRRQRLADGGPGCCGIREGKNHE